MPPGLWVSQCSDGGGECHPPPSVGWRGVPQGRLFTGAATGGVLAARFREEGDLAGMVKINKPNCETPS